MKTSEPQTATFTPHDKVHGVPVTGIFVEWINGGDGCHIYAPLPGDTSRVVRVWKQDGEIVVSEPAKAMAEPEPRTLTPMSMDEARAHLDESIRERPLGLSWNQIEAMQGGKLRP